MVSEILCPLSLCIDLSIDLCEWSNACLAMLVNCLVIRCDYYLLVECYVVVECGGR